jgi:hypothetical protein
MLEWLTGLNFRNKQVKTVKYFCGFLDAPSISITLAWPRWWNVSRTKALAINNLALYGVESEGHACGACHGRVPLT